MPLYIKFRNYLDSLPLATRIAFFVFFFFIIYLTWNFNFWQDNKDARAAINIKITTITTEVRNLQMQLQALEVQLNNKKAEALAKANAPKQLDNSENQPKLLSAIEMNNVLENLLTNKFKLSLLEFRTLPLKNIVPNQASVTLFEHGVLIRFKGDYFSTINYLKAIEELKWRLFWDKLEYKVVQYPIAEITIQVHTLSDEEGWIHA